MAKEKQSVFKSFRMTDIEAVNTEKAMEHGGYMSTSEYIRQAVREMNIKTLRQARQGK